MFSDGLRFTPPILPLLQLLQLLTARPAPFRGQAALHSLAAVSGI